MLSYICPICGQQIRQTTNVPLLHDVKKMHKLMPMTSCGVVYSLIGLLKLADSNVNIAR